MSCSSSKSPAIDALENWLDSHDNNYSYCVIIPGAGCEGCILGTEFFVKRYYGRSDILFIFTRIETLKLLKHKLGQETVNSDNVIFDVDNEFETVKQGTNNIYPTVCKIKEDKVEKIIYVTPENDGLSELEQYIKNNPAHIINMDSYFEQSRDKINLSEILDSLSYIALKTPDYLPVDIILDVEDADDCVFVLDRSQKIYRFDKQGHFLNLIGNKGEGADEYINIVELDVDEQKNFINLYDIYKRKILVFDYQGSYMYSIPIPEHLMNVTRLNDSTYIGYKPFYLSENKCEELIFFDINGRNTDILQLTQMSLNNDINIDIFRMGNFNKLRKGANFKSPYEDIMYTITPNNDYYQNIKVDLGRYLLPIDVAINTEKYNKHLNSSYIYELKFQQYNKWVFIDFFYKMENYRVLYNLLNKKFYTIFRGKFPEGIFNDIDGSLSFWPIYKINDESAIGVINSVNMNEDDNPVLQLGVFK